MTQLALATSPYASLIASLDADQRAIVLGWQPGQSLQVLAAAGSGKTRTIVALVARVILEGILQPHEVVVTTFTRKAADELKRRLQQVLPLSTVEALRVGTYHSLAIRHLARTHLRLDFTHGLDIRMKGTSVPDAGKLWMEILGWGKVRSCPSLAALDIKNAYAPSYSLAADCIRADGHKPGSPEAIERAIVIEKGTIPLGKDGKPVPGAKPSGGLDKFVAAWQMFEKAKKILNAWDFADAIHAYMERVEAGHDSAKLVFVDEAQDNNRVQMRIARALAVHGEGSVIYVGDVRQAIYGWRGAAPALFAGATDDLGAARMEIRSNYRSTGRIIEFANEVARDQSWSLGSLSQVGRPELVGSIEVRGHADVRAEGDEVATMIEKSVAASAHPYGSHAILVRTNAAAAHFETSLLVAGIPVVVQGSSSFFTRKHVLDAIAYLQLAESPTEAALRRVVNVAAPHLPARFIGAAFVDSVLRVLGTETVVTPAALVAAITRVGQQLPARGSREGAAEFARVLTALMAVPKADPLDTLRDPVELTPRDRWLYRLEQLAAYYTPPPAAPDADGKIAEPDADDAVVIVSTLCSIAKRFETADELAAFGLQCAGKVKSVDADGDRLKDRVTISTVHRAKGLEWPVVFVSASAKTFPHARSETKLQMEEERRLFYVAITRAESRLVLTYAHKNARNQDAGPSEFLDLLPDQSTEPTPPPMKALPPPEPAARPTLTVGEWAAQRIAERSAQAVEAAVLEVDVTPRPPALYVPPVPAPAPVLPAPSVPVVAVAPESKLTLAEEAAQLARMIAGRWPLISDMIAMTPKPPKGTRAVAVMGGSFTYMLKELGFVEEPELGQRTWAYRFKAASVVLRIWSSIMVGEEVAREVGEDSIRITLTYTNPKTGESRALISRPAYTARVRSWPSKVYEKTTAVLERLAKSPKSCSYCGAATVLAETHAGLVFSACIRWCRKGGV